MKQRLSIWLVGVILASGACSAVADVYKCRTAAGKIEISSTPCTGGRRTEKAVAADPVSPEQRELAERDLKRAREYVADREQSQRAEREAEERAAERQRKQLAETPPPPPPPASAPGAIPSAGSPYVIVADPIARCRYAVEQQHLSPLKREEALAKCNALGAPAAAGPTKLGPANPCEAAADQVLPQAAKERRYANCNSQTQRK